jgi:hypothetical protein
MATVLALHEGMTDQERAALYADAFQALDNLAPTLAWDDYLKPAVEALQRCLARRVTREGAM